MAKVRVAVAGTIGKSILIDDSVPRRVEALEAAVAAIGSAGGGLHSALRNLQVGDDHPQYTMWQAVESIKATWDFDTLPTIQTVLLPEYIEDRVGGMLIDTPTVDFTYNDTLGQITAVVPGAALTGVNDTNVTISLSGNPTTALARSAAITLGWTGTLAAARGGTGTASYTVGDILYASGTTALSKLGIGTDGQVLTLVSGLPAWAAATGGGSGSFSGARVTRATTQAIAGTTAVAFTSEDYDQTSYHDNVTNNSRVTVPTTGYYGVKAGVEFSAAGNTTAAIRKNGTTLVASTALTVTANQRYTLACSVSLTAADYIELVVTNSASGSVDVTVMPPFLAIERLADTGNTAATYLTENDETADLPNSRQLLAGTNVTFDDSVPGERTVSASGGGGGGYPSTIDDLVYWFQADLLAMSSGTKVVMMENSNPFYSGLCGNASGTGGSRSATQLNSLNVMTFPASSAGRYLHVVGYLLKTSTVFVVFKPSSLASDGAFISGPSGSFQALIEATTGKMRIQKTFVAVMGTATTGNAAGTWFQANVTYNDATGVFAFRRNQAADGNGVNAQTTSANTSGIGYDVQGATSELAGDLAELIVYNRVLTAPEIAGVEAYLNAKWGV